MNADKRLTDKKLNTFVPLKTNVPLIVSFGKKVSIDRVMLQENIANGQKIKSGLVEYWDGNAWEKLSSFTTVGYKRLIRSKQVETAKVRMTITATKGPVQLAEIGFFKASLRE